MILYFILQIISKNNNKIINAFKHLLMNINLLINISMLKMTKNYKKLPIILLWKVNLEKEYKKFIRKKKK
jgi:hypothetical protein